MESLGIRHFPLHLLSALETQSWYLEAKEQGDPSLIRSLDFERKTNEKDTSAAKKVLFKALDNLIGSHKPGALETGEIQDRRPLSLTSNLNQSKRPKVTISRDPETHQPVVSLLILPGSVGKSGSLVFGRQSSGEWGVIVPKPGKANEFGRIAIDKLSARAQTTVVLAAIAINQEFAESHTKAGIDR